MASWQQWFANASRDCVFDAKAAIADVAVLCHEVRGIDASDDEQVFVSVRDVRRGISEDTTTLGTASQLRGVSLEATLLLRVWAGTPGARQPSRSCGELLIPLPWLVTRSQGVLYQTWVALEPPRDGLDQSTESSAGAAGPGSSFDRQLARGSTLEGARVCLSVCRLSELGANGRLALAMDAPSDARADRWCALLTSQTQHEAISAALNERALYAADGDAREEQRLRRLLVAQAEELEEVQRQLRASAPAPAATETAAAGAAAAPPGELSRANAARQRDLESLRGELESLSIEANSKIDAANDRIRSLRRDRDDAREEAQSLRGEAVCGERELAAEQDLVRQLATNKESLLEIVEDLHRTCSGAGLEALGRNSIDSITNKFRFD